jgi:hypothetical protein
VNVVSIVSKITSVSRKTLYNSIAGGIPLSPPKQKQLRDDFQAWVARNKTRIPELENIGKTKPEKPARDDFEAYPWHDYLILHAERFLRYSCNAKTKSVYTVLPKASMEELHGMEGVDYDLLKWAVLDNFEYAKQVLVENWEKVPLTNVLPTGKAAVAATRSWQELLPSCRLMEFHSFLYILALIDVGIGQGELPVLADLLPVRKGKRWDCPVKSWLISIQKQLGAKTIDDLGLIISDWLKVEPDNEEYGIRNVKRWRSGKHLPSWKHVAIICTRLDPSRKYQYSRQYLRFIIARVFQLIHDDRLRSGISDDFLENLYAAYPDWHSHHCALNKKRPPQGTPCRG